MKSKKEDKGPELGNHKKAEKLFNMIAYPYGFFYGYQKNMYRQVIEKSRKFFNFADFESVLDLGCGTGALCAALKEEGLEVTGSDLSKRMLEIAKKKNPGINFVLSDATRGLDFQDKTFDIVTASYVAHGMVAKERQRLYREMGRLAKEYVIIYDYNEKRSPLTSFVEYLEGGDYFNFIKSSKEEMEECSHDMGLCFESVVKKNIGKRSAIYICKPGQTIPG